MKRDKANGQKGATEIFEGAKEVINPPLNIDLGKGVRPYWDLLVKCKAARAWQKQDLILLVELSRNLFRTEKLSLDLIGADELIETATGIKANPSFGVLDQMVKRARLIYTMLQIHPEATQGKSNKQVVQNKVHADAVQALDNNDDDLIPSAPTAH